MRNLRTTIILGGGALALGAGALLAGPAQASDSGSNGTKPAAPVPAGTSVAFGGSLGDSPITLPPGVTPAKPLPAGTTVVDGGVIESGVVHAQSGT